ncbi:unnamed protein product, partial [Ilex paraguariensis]
IATFVGTEEPQSFDALASKASNVERQIARQKNVPQKSRMTQEKNFDSENPVNKKEAMPTFLKVDKKKGNDKRKEISQKGKETSRNLSLKERKEVKYTFEDDDVE